MPTLVRLSKSPSTHDLTPEEIAFIDAHFQVTPQDITLSSITFAWDQVTEIETALAARSNSPAGWFVRKIVYGGGDRYHIAVYAGRAEAVLPNTSLNVIRHIVQTIAYYAPKTLRYAGLPDITPLNDDPA
jgi:hypothetical protein